MPAHELKRELAFWDLVLFNIAAVAGVRWLAAAARIGLSALVLWLLAAVLFFVPSALAVARLGSRYPAEGGIYVWTRQSFGEWHGFFCGWCYWLSNLFYFPNLLLAGVGTAAYAFGERGRALSENPALLVVGALLLLWIGALTNLVGLHVGKWTENVGAAATYGAGLLLSAGAFAVWMKNGVPQGLGSIWPRWDWSVVNFWSQIAFAFGGLELSAVMGAEIRDPRHTVPRAAWTSAGAIAAFYLCGTAAMVVLVPAQEVNIITGLAQAGHEASRALGAERLGPLVAVLMTMGITGQLGAWLGGSARLPFVIGVDRYLPRAFARLHPRWGTPHVAILAQAVACSVFLLAMQAGESLRAGYQLLVDMTVVTYFIPFLYMFAAGRREGLRASSLAGLGVTIMAIAVSLVPPRETRAPWLFEAKLLGGCAAVGLAARIVYRRASGR